MNALTYLLVALGGAIGSVTRAWVSVMAVRLVGAGFPWGTMVINIVGSLVIGMVAASALSPTRTLITQEVRIFLMVGFCGGFTTFSSFSLQTFELLREGRPARGPGQHRLVGRHLHCGGLCRLSRHDSNLPAVG